MLFKNSEPLCQNEDKRTNSVVRIWPKTPMKKTVSSNTKLVQLCAHEQASYQASIPSQWSSRQRIHDRGMPCTTLLPPIKGPKTLDPENRLGAKSVGTVVASNLSFLGFSSPDSEGARRLDHEMPTCCWEDEHCGFIEMLVHGEGECVVWVLSWNFLHWEMASHGDDGIQVWITSSVSVSLCPSVLVLVCNMNACKDCHILRS
jgi:hypothetical protein